MFHGQVTEHDESKRWWQVTCADGDEEQLDFRELCRMDIPPDFTCFRYSTDGTCAYMFISTHACVCVCACLFMHAYI